jgi:hypothetical protein
MEARRFFSVDSAKAVKAVEFGYLNGINYMAPANLAGAGNLCPHASPGCLALCLGWFSGQAGMVATDATINSVRASRIAKARLFMSDRKAFFQLAIDGACHVIRAARKAGLKPCLRMNGATDIAWESVKMESGLSIVEFFPGVQFVDYTKSVKRALRHARGELPANYHLTFSRSETNHLECLWVLEAGGNVAVVSSLARPAMWHGFPTVDGDLSDLRHLDPRGHVVWLSPKGAKAKADKSGFVVR